MLYVFDTNNRVLEILADTNDIISDVVIEQINGEFSYELTVDTSSKICQYLTEFNKVGFMHEGNLYLFTIRNVNDEKVDYGKRTVYCEHDSYDLMDNIVEDRRIEQGNARVAIERALTGSSWKVGNVDEFGLQTLNFYYQDSKTCLKEVAEVYGGELKYRIVLAEDGASVAGRYVDMYHTRGTETGLRFEFDKNMDKIKRTVNTLSLKNAYIGRGKAPETDEGGYSRRILFDEVVWSKAGGNPVDKPAGQKWVGDPDSIAKYGMRLGVIECEEETAESLIQFTYDKVLETKDPKVTYEAEVSEFEKFMGGATLQLGDQVIVLDEELGISLQARIIEQQFSIIPDETKIIKIGNFIETGLGLTPEDVKQEVDKVIQQIQKPSTDSSFPDEVPSKPELAAQGLFSAVSLAWTYENRVYFEYMLYASKTKGFTPNEMSLIYRGKGSSHLHQVNPNETWYYRVVGVNSHGSVGVVSDEVKANTLKINDSTKYFDDMAIKSASIGSLNADVINAGHLKGQHMDMREVVVTDGNDNRTFHVDSFGNVSIKATSLHLTGNDTNLANKEYVGQEVDNGLSEYDRQLNQVEVFNKLTNNGTTQGIYLQDNKVYLNGEYIQTGTLRADLIKVQLDENSNLLPFNYVTMDNAINTDKFYINTADNGVPFADCELPIYGGGGSGDYFCVPFGYSDATIKSGKSYWFSCEYYAVWDNDTKPDDGKGSSTVGSGKYGTKTGNNMDIFLFNGNDSSELNTGRNLLNNTDGRSLPVMFTASTPAVSGFGAVATPEDSYDYGNLMLRAVGGSEEHYYRFMPPVGNQMYGLEAGCTYTLSGLVCGTMPEITIRHQHHVANGAWQGTDTHVIPILSTDDWKPFTYTFTIPSDAVGFYLSFQDYNQVANKIVYLSRLKLEKSSVATPWCPSPADSGESLENPYYVEESKPLLTLASVRDFNQSVNITEREGYGGVYQRSWTKLVGRIDAKHDYTGRLWINIDGSGFDAGDMGYFYLCNLQLVDASEHNEAIELDYITQLKEKRIELSDGVYYTNTLGVDGVQLQNGRISGEFDYSYRKFSIDENGFKLRSGLGSENVFTGSSRSYYSYYAGSTGKIEGFDNIYGTGCVKPIGGNNEGIFVGVHEGFQVPNSTDYGRADIYSYRKYDGITAWDDWTDWELLGERIEPKGLVRRNSNSNIEVQNSIILKEPTGHGGETYQGSSLWSEGLYNATGNGQLLNHNVSNQRIYFGNSSNDLWLETKGAVNLNQNGTSTTVITNGTQYGHPRVNIYTGNNIDIWADSDCSTDTERIWLGAGKNAITITSSHSSQNNMALKYNGSAVMHAGNKWEHGLIYGNTRSGVNSEDTARDFNKIWRSGFYEGLQPSNAPQNIQGAWWWLINSSHRSNDNSGNYQYGMQICAENNSSNFFMRTTNQWGAGTWHLLAHSDNMYRTRDEAHTGRDTGANMARVFAYNLYNKSLKNGDGGSSAYGGYWSVLHWGCGAAGSAQLAIDWTSSGKGIYMRSLRDTIDNWWTWKRIPNDQWGMSSTSDIRYKRVVNGLNTTDCYEMVKNISLYSYLLLNNEQVHSSKKIDPQALYQEELNAEGISRNLQIGVIAQDVLNYECGQFVVVQDILKDENGNVLSDKYEIDPYNYASAILGGLQEEIKLRDKQYNELKQENAEVKDRLAELENKFQILEQLIKGV